MTLGVCVRAYEVRGNLCGRARGSQSDFAAQGCQRLAKILTQVRCDSCRLGSVCISSKVHALQQPRDFPKFI
jgi:hypothetical protein